MPGTDTIQIICARYRYNSVIFFYDTNSAWHCSDKKDPTSVDVPVGNYLKQVTGEVKDLVIGVNEEYFFNRVDSDIEKLVRASIQALVDQGARVEEVKIPALQYAEWAELVTSLSEASAIHHSDMLTKKM